MEAELPVLRCNNIVVSPRGIAEADGKKAALFVPAGDVEHIILKHGKSEHHPIVSLLIGAVLGLIGLVGLIELIRMPKGLRYEAAMIFFGIIGGSMIFDAMKQRYFLEVHKKGRGNCRLIFSKEATLKDIKDFCQNVRATYNYKITEKI